MPLVSLLEALFYVCLLIAIVYLVFRALWNRWLSRNYRYDLNPRGLNDRERVLDVFRTLYGPLLPRESGAPYNFQQATTTASELARHFADRAFDKSESAIKTMRRLWQLDNHLRSIEEAVALMATRAEVDAEVIIIGGGPAGLGAAAAIRSQSTKKVSVCIIEADTQLLRTKADQAITNYVNQPSGTQFIADQLKELKTDAGVSYIKSRATSLVVEHDGQIKVSLSNETCRTARYVVIATGAVFKRLEDCAPVLLRCYPQQVCLPAWDTPPRSIRVAVCGASDTAIKQCAFYLNSGCYVTLIYFGNVLPPSPDNVAEYRSWIHEKNKTEIAGRFSHDPNVDSREQLADEAYVKQRFKSFDKIVVCFGVTPCVELVSALAQTSSDGIECASSGQVLCKNERSPIAGLYACGDCRDGKQSSIGFARSDGYCVGSHVTVEIYKKWLQAEKEKLKKAS